MTTEVILTIAAIAVEVALLVFISIKGGRKPTPGKVRLFPYRPASVVLVVLILLTGAHAVSLVSGSPLKARNMMKGQH